MFGLKPLGQLDEGGYVDIDEFCGALRCDNFYALLFNGII